MNISDFMIPLAQAAEVQQTTLFPFPFDMHLAFCCVAFLFFLFQFGRQKRPYQIIMALAIPLSLTIWLSTDKMFFYAVGIVEVLVLIAAFISSVIYKKKHPEEYAEEKAEEKADENASPKE